VRACDSARVLRVLTRAGAQVVKEHYLRDDIYCGSPLAAPEHRGAPPRRAARR
jgi:hypothetical protein